MMQYGRLFLFLCVFLASSACSGTPAPASPSQGPAPQLSQAVVHGRQADTSGPFDAVAKLTFVYERTMCSGTLIAPDTVLTAAHCVPHAWSMSGGVQRLSEAQRIAVTWQGGRTATRFAHAVAVHPNYHGLLRCSRPLGQMEQKACDTFARQCGALGGEAQDQCLSTLDKQVRHALGLNRLWPTHDIALIFLDAPVLGMPLARVVDDHCCSDLVRAHAPVVVAGYGQQGETAARPGAMGIMQHGHNYVVEAGAGELRVDGNNRAHPCFGDSGGPVFTEVDHDGQTAFIQVGVASRVWDYHPARGCASGLAYTRIDDEGGFLGESMRDACVEGARRHCEDGVGPQLSKRSWREHESCQQGPAPWGVVLLMIVWLAARRKMRRAA